MENMDQTKKLILSNRLKEVLPKSWVWTMRVRGGTLYLTIRKAPLNLIKMALGDEIFELTNLTINHHDLSSHFKRFPEIRNLVLKIRDTLIDGNNLVISFGSFETPFKVR